MMNERQRKRLSLCIVAVAMVSVCVYVESVLHKIAVVVTTGR